ncbi:MAG: TMEM175 family protein [Solirubrobacterales bacterium]
MAARRIPTRRREENEIEFSRILAFSDGVFAIAITLLVLQIEVPRGVTSSSELWHEVFRQNGDLYAFALSFAVIGRFWVIHHRFFTDVRGFDGRLLTINLVYLFWMVTIPFSSQVLGEYGGEASAVIIYAVNLALATLTSALMTTYAVRAGLTTEGRDEEIRSGRNGGLWACAVFIASIPVAAVAPHLAPLIWLALFFDPSERIAHRVGVR